MKSSKKPRVDPLSKISQLNHELETTGGIASADALWTEWTWQTNPEEPFEASVLLNRSQLLGLLLCRHMANTVQARQAAAELEGSRMVLIQKSPSQFSLRELRDTIDNLLIEWPLFVKRLAENPRAAENCAAVASLVDGCFARLGWLAMNPAGADCFDDAASTEPHPGDRMRLSRPGLRRFIGSFLVLYRHIDLLTRAKKVTCKEPVEPGVRKHHVEASTDDFHLLCMNTLLPTAAKLNYKQDFPGMYNHVSQVIYFHNPQYERAPRAELEEILRTGEPVQALPALCQIHPEIQLAYEEDCIDLSRPTGKWWWLVLPRRIYLVDPQSEVYHSDCLWDLLSVYKQGSWQKEPAG